MDMALPMNTGAEAVETALKAVRKWAYTVKGVAADKAEIIVCSGNFHTAAPSPSSVCPPRNSTRTASAPFPAGFKTIPYGDADALEKAIGPNTAAFLVEPHPGRGRHRDAARGLSPSAADICRKHKVLLIADEIRTRLGAHGCAARLRA